MLEYEAVSVEDQHSYEKYEINLAYNEKLKILVMRGTLVSACSLCFLDFGQVLFCRVFLTSLIRKSIIKL